jgi:hypothetical protein
LFFPLVEETRLEREAMETGERESNFGEKTKTG